MAAPSAGNQQPWHFIVIRDREPAQRHPRFHPYAAMAPGAPVGILVCGDPSPEKHAGYWVQDCAAATENLLLAAAARGSGRSGAGSIRGRTGSRVSPAAGDTRPGDPVRLRADRTSRGKQAPGPAIHPGRVHLDRW